MLWILPQRARNEAAGQEAACESLFFTLGLGKGWGELLALPGGAVEQVSGGHRYVREGHPASWHGALHTDHQSWVTSLPWESRGDWRRVRFLTHLPCASLCEWRLWKLHLIVPVALFALPSCDYQKMPLHIARGAGSTATH